ncbi:unnamed protein product [Pseudo-nitzschia multistriata]|uniref:TauD/TfdA-like domain-containing protein n=1 Tax=Pseudo-nitzschia multistriata TaxID=183589 RepID=A0A448ZA05_9STRA|nr:unnamed protein product [Pseudo-nitzschia multistriata]
MGSTTTATTTTTLSLPSFDSCIVTDAPEQHTFEDGLQVPFVLSPSLRKDNGDATVRIETPEDAARFVRNHRTAIDQMLEERGAVLFRGFPLETPDDFNAFVEAFDGYTDLSYEKSMSFAVRTKLAHRICTTNEGKSGGLVFHHEQAQTPLWPSHVFFCCQLPARPGDGGETGIVSSPLVYDELRRRHPGFCSKLEAEGVRYTVFAGPRQDPSKGAGRSWKSFFHASTREECERKMGLGGWTWEWGVGPSNASASVGSDFLKCTTPVLEAVKKVGNSGRKCFFNQLIATTANALEFGRKGGGDQTHRNGYDPLVDVPTQEGIDECVRFGNGDPVSLEVLLEAKEICEELAIDVRWQKGDVVLLSNYLMMHARRPWKGPEGTRKLLASLVQEEHCTSFGRPLVA